MQSQVEDYFQATRQQVFKLDDVTSSQRAAVYSQVTFTSPFPPPPSSHFSYYELVLMISNRRSIVVSCPHSCIYPNPIYPMKWLALPASFTIYLSLLPLIYHRHNYQRRAFLSSSDEGMLETFTKYCHTTMSEIVDAAFRCLIHLLPSLLLYTLPNITNE